MIPSLLAAATVPDAAAVETPLVAWIVFGTIILSILVLDLLIFNRKAHVQGVREAATWSAVWVGLALLFNVGVYFWKDDHGKSAVDFTTAYLVEQALSVDNLFIFLVIFRYFSVPTVFQHRVLFWGVLGAQLMRAVMIFSGVELLKQFHGLIFVFGAILVFTGLKMLLAKDETYEPSKTLAFRLTRRLVPITDSFRGERFFCMENGRRMATPLFLVLVIVESTDLIFAVDSIPACLAITRDPFVVYTSNIFAVMGLRAFYFLLSGMMGNMRFLKPALSIVLVFIGGKMIVAEAWGHNMDNKASLAIVAGILFIAILASIWFPGKPTSPPPGVIESSDVPGDRANSKS